MYLRAIRCHLREGIDRDTALEIYNELVPALAFSDGFRGSSLLVNENTRMAVALIYWDSESDAGRAGESVRPLLFERTCALTDSALDISGYRVLRHTMVRD